MTAASIITIGDELLIGQVVDTNSCWIAQQLNMAGIAVVRRVAVGDDADQIWKTLGEETLHAQIILITGGLGPTADDITKPLLCKYFGGKLIIDEPALENVKYLFEQVFKRPVTEVNLKQAEVPDVCTVIQNKRGTAPGMWFEKSGKIYISMPGVPHEMKGILEDALPLLKDHFRLPVIIHKTLLTAGIGESMLAEQISDLEASLPKHIKLAYLPAYGMVRLRLSSSSYQKTEIEQEINKYFLQLQKAVSPYLVTNEDESMAQTVGKILTDKNKTLATAESCTGGYIAHLITSIAGSSKFYIGSIISYSNDVKTALLDVPVKTLKDSGAVSESTVIHMANGLLKKIPADYSIAVSGVMGPEGGTAEKPVGTVWIAVASTSDTKTMKLSLRFDRERNIQITAIQALNFMRKFILDIE
ncbi:CinA family nicotinamide mononucleotide deamidase-related protein [soil metagenome]